MKMKKRKVIDDMNLPVKPPLTTGLLIWLLLRSYNTPGWVLGVFGTLFGILVFGWILSFWTEEKVNIFNKEENK